MSDQMAGARRSRGIAFTLIGATVLLAAWAKAPVPKSRAGVCVGAADYLSYLTDQVRALVADPAKQEIRDSLHLTSVAAESIQGIQTDSLCDLAGRAINREQHILESTPRSVFLVRIGSARYWAEDPNVGFGEYTKVFILDSTLSKVIATTGH